MLRRVKNTIGNFLPALKSPPYRLYFIGQGISLIGTWMQDIAQQWLIYPVLTNNQSLLGIVSFVNLIPTAVLALFAGVIVDRINKKYGLIAMQATFAVIAFVLWVLIVTGKIQVWHVMVATFLYGIVFAFDQPTRQSFMTELVERQYYGSAISLNTAIFNAARALGPAVAGLLIASIGISPAYLLNSVSFLAVIIGVALIHPIAAPTSRSEDWTFRKGFLEGWQYILQHKVIAVLLGLIFLLTAGTWPLSTLLPVFAHDIFKTGEVGFGLLQAAFGIGGLIGALLFYKTFERMEKFKLLVIALMTVGIMEISFALNPFMILALVIQLFSGWAVITVITSCNTLIQMSVPPELRGRLISYYSLVLIGGMPIGALIASLGVASIGARLTVLLCAVIMTIGSAILIAATRGKFRVKLEAMI